MIDENLKQAAIKLCETRGLDPYNEVRSGENYDWWCQRRPQWELFYSELEEFKETQDILKAAGVMG